MRLNDEEFKLFQAGKNEGKFAEVDQISSWNVESLFWGGLINFDDWRN